MQLFHACLHLTFPYTCRPNIYLEYRGANVTEPLVALKEYIDELREKGVGARKAVIYTMYGFGILKLLFKE